MKRKKITLSDADRFPVSLESSGLVKKTTLSNVASNEIRNELNGSDLGNKAGCQQNWENTDRLVNWWPTNAKIKRHMYVSIQNLIVKKPSVNILTFSQLHLKFVLTRQRRTGRKTRP